MNKQKERKSFILIVDDDKQVLKSLKIWLKNEGFKAMTASSGEEALRVVEEHPIEVALVDLKMMQEDGIDVARQLRETDDMLKIIMLTGFPSYETAVKAMKVGVFDYISKGSPNEKILETIEKAISERETMGGSYRASDLLTRESGLRVLLFCNHSLLKERLENYSKDSPDFKLIRSLPSVDSLGVKDISQQIDIALICAGCNMRSVEEAYTVLPELYHMFPEIKPVIINENFTDQEKVEFLKLGVKGFSPPDLGSGRLEEALHRIKNGEIWVSRNVVDLSLQNLTSSESDHIISENHRFGLTDREIEILRTMALGLRNKEIADKLFISEKTVKTHINRVFRKLGVTTRANAIFKAVENKII
ncbi:MAG: response regulator [Candidatus Aminicenantes bacterium]|nr:response regulator [Candidatus Aminicenantes bacterium]NIM80055.1 response regulator [Candidatus Aminicenantes bacterium]NIN19398.1 response regulator [Candidatus Aminicenantes bacterium]NIN43297.1 response regulator [Candidatus Aminicenantes bacterium]NIN86041.1 response regulator [Candidatus Aminicenantes bacterium]